jgi:hypothetical protein
VRVIPCICITRILADLEAFLSNRGNGDAKGWYHRQFWEAAEAWLFKDEGLELRASVHAELADYFSGKHHGAPKRYSTELHKVIQKHFPGETEGDRLVPLLINTLSAGTASVKHSRQRTLGARPPRFRCSLFHSTGSTRMPPLRTDHYQLTVSLPVVVTWHNAE